MGVYLSEPNKNKIVNEGSNQTYRYAAAEMQGWRSHMEDAHISELNLSIDSAIFGVFDGHGGKEVAKYVEKYFCDELKKNPNFKSGAIEAALKENFMKMDIMLSSPEGKKELFSIKNDNKEETLGFQGESFAGCTANVSLIYKNTLYVANAGDSRSILATKGGEIVRMSIDHKPDQDLEKQRIIKAGGFVTDGRVNANLNLSRAIGDLEYKRNAALPPDQQLIIAFPDVQSRPVTKDDDFILMGCDGVWETLSEKEIVDFIYAKLKEKTPLKTIAEELLDKLIAPDTLNGIGCDNMTMVLIVFNK